MRWRNDRPRNPKHRRTMNRPDFVHAVEGYTMSRDYRLLLVLMRKAAVMCLVDYRFSTDSHEVEACRDATHTIWNKDRYGEHFQISSRGHGYIHADTEDGFMHACSRANVEFFVPNERPASLQERACDEWHEEDDSREDDPDCCPECQGEGKVVTHDYESYFGANYKPCPVCGGDPCIGEPPVS